MNTQTIIKALNVPNAGSFAKHATKLSNILKFINQVKADIISAVIIERGKMFFGAETEVNYSRTDREGNFLRYDRCKGVEFDSATIEIKTGTGCYKITIPDNTQVFNYACFLLNIGNDSTIAATEQSADIVAPAALAKYIGKALKFISKDSLRPEMQHVCLEFERGNVTVVSTNGYALYYSASLPFSGNYSGQILLNKETCSQLAKFKKPGNISFYLGEGGHLAIKVGDQLLNTELYTEKRYPDYKAVTPRFEDLHPMQVNKQLLTSVIKPMLPGVKKVANNQIKFHLNGSVGITATDYDYSREATANLPYISKDFDCIDIRFDGKVLVQVFDTLCTTKDTYYAQDNPDVITWHIQNTGWKRAIFTGNTPGEKVLLMALTEPQNEE